jgi:RimJ/RimL family protein N-acetyltransferase
MKIDSDLQLIELQASALFTSDADGRLRYIREPGYPDAALDPAPRFFMGRTRAGNVWRFRHDLPDELVRELEALCCAEPAAANLADPPTQAGAIRALLEEHAPIADEWRGPAYRVPDSVHAPAEVILISEINAHLLEANFPWTITEPGGFKIGPLAAAVAGNRAVSICFCSRITAQAAEAGVETVEAARRHGYASAAVAAWAAAVRRRGLVALYSTSWENLASQGVARKLGMIRYGDDWSIT